MSANQFLDWMTESFLRVFSCIMGLSIILTGVLMGILYLIYGD